MSIKIICTCDYCGKTITGRIGYIGMDYHKDNKYDGDLEGNPKGFEASHFCEDCMNEITKMIRAGKPAEQAQTEYAPEEEVAELDGVFEFGSEDIKMEDVKEVQEKPKGKPVDHGKIMALHRAGWKVKDIARDVGCSDQTVRNHLQMGDE